MSQDPSTLLLEHHLKALKLPTFLRDYTSVAAVVYYEDRLLRKNRATFPLRFGSLDTVPESSIEGLFKKEAR
jgi:hypothetical protein